jgi:N-acetylglucosaminyl-diphospho-decaprenol L-rhamnosyltransferase
MTSRGKRPQSASGHIADEPVKLSADAIIVTFNSSEPLREQLACRAIRHAFSRIVVVDNASADGSRDVALTAGVDLIARTTNGGFAAAVNAGMRWSDSEFVAILNPDIVLDDVATVTKLLAHFSEPDVGLVAPLLVLPNGDHQDSAREVPSPVELLKRKLTGKAYGVIRPDGPTDVPWVVAAFIVVRREAVNAIGGFDEGYFLYFEDVDLCVRLWQHGWRVRVDSSLTAQHAFNAESRRALAGLASRRHLRSAVRFFRKHPQMLRASGRRQVGPPATRR